MRIFSTKMTAVATALGLSLFGAACNSSKQNGGTNTAAPVGADQVVDGTTEPGEVEPKDEAPEEDFTASIGVKNFRQLTATYETLTGVTLQGDVLAEYEAQLSSLPKLVDASSLSASQISGITKLAAAYCYALSNDQALRTAKFPNVDFTAPTVADSTAYAADMLNVFYGPETMLQGSREMDIASIATLVDTLNLVDYGDNAVVLEGTAGTNIFTGACASTLSGPEIILY